MGDEICILRQVNKNYFRSDIVKGIKGKESQIK